MNMINNYLLSIVIPTRNRGTYTFQAVNQILEVTDSSVQIVIQDNSDTRTLQDMISSATNQKRVKYNYIAGEISFVDNFNIAVDIADGEYLCLIGDDDGIVPQIVDVVRWAKAHQVDAIKPETNAVYFWPASEAIKNQLDNGYLQVNHVTGKARICNPKEELKKLLNQGAMKYLELDLVKLYHGIVSKRCLDQVKQMTGRYFGGLSPDIYISVALSLVVEQLIEIDFPLTISGICNKSGSADSATGRHTGQLKDAPHFRGHQAYNWSELVPMFYCVETIWADSALAAVKEMGRTDLYNEFNVAYLTKYCNRLYPQYQNEIINNYHHYLLSSNRSKSEIVMDLYVSSAKDLIRRLFSRIARIFDDVSRINNVGSIEMVNDILQSILTERGIQSLKVITSLNKHKLS
jgi:glycosyltransferase involved in cell wall biosynthesis